MLVFVFSRRDWLDLIVFFIHYRLSHWLIDDPSYWLIGSSLLWTHYKVIEMCLYPQSFGTFYSVLTHKCPHCCFWQQLCWSSINEVNIQGKLPNNWWFQLLNWEFVFGWSGKPKHLKTSPWDIFHSTKTSAKWLVLLCKCMSDSPHVCYHFTSSRCILCLGPPKMIVIGLKQHKQARVFFFPLY